MLVRGDMLSLVYEQTRFVKELGREGYERQGSSSLMTTNVEGKLQYFISYVIATKEN
jgi:hypothetical protein